MGDLNTSAIVHILIFAAIIVVSVLLFEVLDRAEERSGEDTPTEQTADVERSR